MHGDAGRVDLHESRVGEVCAFAVACHGCGHVAGHCVGGKEVCVAVSAGGYYHRVGSETLKLAGNEVLGYDASCALHSVFVLDEYHVVHLVAVVALHLSELDLAVERAVCAEKELLAGLAFCVESTGNLRAAERAVGEKAAVFTCERNALSHALVDDIV